jgi:uncharacterized protein
VDTPVRYLPPPFFDDPHADAWTQPFWDATSKEQLTAPRCLHCGHYRMPPTRFCATCRHQDLEYVPLPGTGRLYSFIVVRRPLGPAEATYVPFMPAIVEPDGADGIRFVSNLVDCDPEDAAVGMSLRVVWHRASDTLTLPLWAPPS